LSYLKEGDYVLYGGTLWKVWMQHLGGTYQIKTLEPLKTWIDNLEVKPEDVEIITKEVADILNAVHNHKEK
jgi:hypothetical protein